MLVVVSRQNNIVEDLGIYQSSRHTGKLFFFSERRRRDSGRHRRRIERDQLKFLLGLSQYIVTTRIDKITLIVYSNLFLDGSLPVGEATPRMISDRF